MLSQLQISSVLLNEAREDNSVALRLGLYQTKDNKPK